MVMAPPCVLTDEPAIATEAERGRTWGPGPRGPQGHRTGQPVGCREGGWSQPLWDARCLVRPQRRWPTGQELGWRDPESGRAVSPIPAASLSGEGG